MRKSLLLVAIPVSVVGLGLAAFVAFRATSKPAADSFADDLKQADAAGIQLAQAQAANQFALNETVPEAKPEPKTVTKRGNGTRAVRSNTPTVKAVAEPVVADVVEEIPDLTVMQTAAGPTNVEAPAPSIPRPAPATEPAPAQEEGAILRGGNGAGTGTVGTGGSGGGWGGIFGVVIRGGGVDGDNCEPRPRSRPGTRTTPVYSPNPSAGGYGFPSGGRSAGSTISGGRRPVGGVAIATPTMSRPRGRQ
ncbi:MAG TPA: hypothetical protein VFO55_10950 [Gemmatimonadaceae bacterium]|nr:hypothetical protein [Gemmatimonadaceae bacterium]